MLYWKAEIFDYTGPSVKCSKRLIGRGIEDSFLMFVQGLGASPEGDKGLWVYDDTNHSVEVTLITPSEFMAHRSHGLRFSDFIAQSCDDETAHDYLEFLIQQEMTSEILDTVYDFRITESSEVLTFPI